MQGSQIATIGADLVRLFDAGPVGPLDDAELLRRFVEGRGDPSAQSAFAAIVERRGGLVRGACRRVLRDPHAADDVSQAVFLVLARKARTIRCEGSLGPWLYGVAVRLALRSRTRRLPPAEIEGIEPACPDTSSRAIERAEVLAAIDAEIARLPAVDRAAVVLCHVEGLDHREAARRLRCPLGTLESRLHRARGRLRARLARRGLAPAGLTLAWSALGASSRAALPAALAATLTRVTRTAGGLATTRVASLAGRSVGRAGVRPLRWIAAAMIGLGGLGGGIGLAHRGAEAGDGPVGKTRALAPTPSVGDQIRAVMAEWAAFTKAYEDSQPERKSKEQWRKGFEGWLEKYAACSRKLLVLIEREPTEPASLDAMLWHVGAYWSSGTEGPLRDQMVRSVEVILRHYVGEPRVAWRVLVARNGMPTRLDDQLLPGLVEGSRRRETKGLALLALAEYLEEKAGYVIRVQESKPPFTLDPWRRGAPRTRPFDESYEKELRASDAATVRREARGLFARVVAEFGDIPKADQDYGDPDYPLWTIPKKLGDEATEHLKTLDGFSLGGRPDTSWGDRDGGTTRLSDYRGKVVVLAFWRDGDDSCRREFLHDAKLAREWAGRPFVLVGFSRGDGTGVDASARYALPFRRPDGREAVARDGPIRARFGVDRDPAVVVLDADGVVRFQCGESVLLEGYIDGLVREAEAKAAKK